LSWLKAMAPRIDIAAHCVFLPLARVWRSGG
jgi:hypothetical protein